MITKERLSLLIDHTLLRPDATKDGVKRLCEEAKKYGFWSVCVNPYYVPFAKQFLRMTDIRVCSVVGFPLGANTPEGKGFEADKAIRDGADEIDMVINIGALKSGDYNLVKLDIKAVVEKAEAHGDIVVKVIIETGLLRETEKALACDVVRRSGAHFVKTSTGFNGPGATVEDVKLLRRLVGQNFGVKASGGIRNYSDAMKMIQAGANRLGTSSGVAIIKEANRL